MRLAISERPALRHTMLAGGLASASHRSTSESFPSSRSICGEPSSLMVGASVGERKVYCEADQGEVGIPGFCFDEDSTEILARNPKSRNFCLN